jgi:hypothetical protein
MKSKKIIYSALMGAALISTFMMHLSSCKGKDPEPSAGDLAIASLIASPWKVKVVTVDNQDKTSLFTGFTIAFSKSGAADGSYSSTNGGLVWPATGQWTISDPLVAGSFKRNDGLDVQLIEVTTTSLKMSLNWSKNTFGPGRVESISGQHVFTMGK